jgi:hypothetical protein
MSKNQRTYVAKDTAELNILLEDPVSSQRSGKSCTDPSSMVELQLLNLLSLKTALKGKKIWLDVYKTLMSDNWKYVTWSDESSFIFPKSFWVDVWSMPKEANNPECLVPSVKCGGGSVMIGQQYLGILLVP